MVITQTRLVSFQSARRIAGGILLGALGLLTVLALSATPAAAVCYATGRSCGVNASFNDRLCCPGTVCGWGGVCQPGCRINGQFYRQGAVNPQDPCQTCDSTVSTTRWSTAPLCAAPIPFSWDDVSATGTTLSLGDDEVSGPIPVGFTFKYFGVSYSSVFVSSNGFLTVLPGQDSGCCTGLPTPQAGDPDGVIAGWWEDLYPPAGGSITYETLGVAPNRVFVVQFDGIHHYPSGNATWFEFKVFEGTNNIEVHYLDAATDGETHSAGVENQSGSLGVQYFLGTTALPPSSAVRYKTR